MKRMIMGKHTVEELLKSAKDRLVKVYTYKKEDPLFRLLQKEGGQGSFAS